MFLPDQIGLITIGENVTWFFRIFRVQSFVWEER